MGKLIKTVLTIVAIVAVVYMVRYMYQKRTITTEMTQINAEYEKAQNSADYPRLKQQYEALLAKAPSAADRKVIEGMMASCDAWVAFYDVTARGSIKGYEDVIKKMERARDLTGDKQGVWAKNLEEFTARHTASLGPDVNKMRALYERLAPLPFEQARNDLETLYRWRTIWHEQGFYLNDSAREEIFQKTAKILLENYCRIFEESIAKAAKIPDGPYPSMADTQLQVKAVPSNALQYVEHMDKAKAQEYRGKHAKELAEADKAMAVLSARQR